VSARAISPERPAARVVEPDPVDDGCGKHRWPTGRTRSGARAAGLDVLLQETLELRHRDEALAPRRLEAVDQRDDPPVDRGGAESECLGGLPAAVGEPLDSGRLA
jgi:hypothetical protein